MPVVNSQEPSTALLSLLITFSNSATLTATVDLCSSLDLHGRPWRVLIPAWLGNGKWRDGLIMSKHCFCRLDRSRGVGCNLVRVIPGLVMKSVDMDWPHCTAGLTSKQRHAEAYLNIPARSCVRWFVTYGYDLYTVSVTTMALRRTRQLQQEEVYLITLNQDLRRWKHSDNGDLPYLMLSSPSLTHANSGHRAYICSLNSSVPISKTDAIKRSVLRHDPKTWFWVHWNHFSKRFRYSRPFLPPTRLSHRYRFLQSVILCRSLLPIFKVCSSLFQFSLSLLIVHSKCSAVASTYRKPRDLSYAAEYLSTNKMPYIELSFRRSIPGSERSQ